MKRASRRAFAVALETLQSATGEPDLAGDTRFRAQPVALRSRFRAAEAAAAALAAGAGLARRIAVARGASHGAIGVASRHAEASLLSFAYLRFADPARAPAARLAPEERTAAAGFMRSGDGRWVYLHAGFAHNTRGLLELLGVADERRAVAAAVSARYGTELEDAIADAGLCGGMVRSPAEWDASAAGRLLATRPVVEIVQLDDSAPEPFPVWAAHERSGARPLDGIRVLDLTRVLAGPTCARTLASYGARVLRIGAAHLPTIPLFVADTGFGKRSAHLDLRDPAQCKRLRRLLRDSDVFSQGYRTGAMERLGFGPLDAARARPGIVYVSINCYGHEGPWRGRPGWEQLAQTVTGIAHDHGADTRSDGMPALLPAAVTDYTTGYLAALGALAALERRARLGGSYWVRVSLARTGMWLRSLGRHGAVEAKPLDGDEVAGWQDGMDTVWGPVRYLRPAVTLEATPPGWREPPTPPGTHAPSFTRGAPDRAAPGPRMPPRRLMP